MTTGQLDQQPVEKPASPDVRRFVDSLPTGQAGLPVQTPDAKSVFDLMERDHSDRENPVIRMMITGLTWGVVIATLAAVGILTWRMLTGA